MRNVTKAAAGAVMLPKLKAILGVLGFFFLIIVFILPVCTAILLKCHHIHGNLLRCFYKIAGRLWLIRFKQEGSFSKHRPLLIVSNHSTYLDIPVLGQAINVRFTPKTEIAGWPLIGQLCVLAGCVFIDRRRGKTKENRKHLLDALRSGIALSLFPEGSTNDGTGILPFRSSFFSLAEENLDGRTLTIQPVSVHYSRPDGQPLTSEELRKVVWIGDDEFVPHLWEYLQTSGVLATLTCLEPVTLEGFADRKALAKYCEEIISRDMQVKKERLVAEALPNNGG